MMTDTQTMERPRINFIDLLAPYLVRVPAVTVSVPQPHWWEHPDCAGIIEDIAECLLHPTQNQPAQ